MPHQTWTDYFASHTTNEAGNKDTRVFTQAWAQVTPSATKLTTITNDASIAVLALDANNKVMILHSFKNLGGTLLNPTNKYACLIGTGRVTSAVIVDETTLLATCDVTTPTYVSIIACIDQTGNRSIGPPTPNRSSSIKLPMLSIFPTSTLAPRSHLKRKLIQPGHAHPGSFRRGSEI
jgi:hypothetical protein